MFKKQAKDNNGQRKVKVSGGEGRNGRLSQFKNHTQPGDPYARDYMSRSDETCFYLQTATCKSNLIRLTSN